MLMGGARQGENEKVNKVDNIALDERDVIFGEVDGIPSIRSRIEFMISMANAIIIKLLAILKGLYEDMLNVCFLCGHYGHFKDGCPKVQRYGEKEKVADSKPLPTTIKKKVEEEACGD
ncbi:hypothetical protein Goshw_014955 [Gossypium schwendimanii]|uniref:CCHC-type domain-containing protein n=1 Tax=Gossypium schwendimanii TaxID=34291 RepID=A0A7J9MC39_GOSSC|nr:hypothetical protein [Gossypium schwendimanii]